MGKKKSTFFHVFDTHCFGSHGTPLLRLTSLTVMTSINVTVLSLQYGGRLQSK